MRSSLARMHLAQAESNIDNSGQSSPIIMPTQRMAEGIRVRTAAEVPAAALEDFYDRMYLGRAAFLKRHWRWLYRVGSRESVPSPLVAVAGGRVVGHGGLIPVTLRRNNEERTATWFVDFAILPEYQRKGIGMALAQAGMMSCPLQLGFGNEGSVGMLLKCGWETRFHTLCFRLLLRPNRHPSFQGSSMKGFAALAGLATRGVWRARAFAGQELSASPATPDRLAAFSDGDGGVALHVPRSSEFLHWRISTHPYSREYFVLSLRGGRVEEGYSAIARVVDDSGYRRLHLLALRGEPANRHALGRFFAGDVRWAVKNDIHDIVFITSDPMVAKTARWWFPVSKRLRFVCHANDSSGADFLSGTDHMWECLDSDFDLMHVARPGDEVQ